MEDIQSRFIIKGSHEVRWRSKYFSRNLSRLYGKKLPAGSHKETQIGRGPFTLIVVEDENPVYDKRAVRSSRIEPVNTRVFDAKMLYRRWVEEENGLSNGVHATNSAKEAARDLTLLLGRNPNDYLTELDRHSWNGEIDEVNTDLVGAEAWSNIGQLFYVLNSTICYVVLRNFECLPDEYHIEGHGDIDLLVADYDEARRLMNARPVRRQRYRVLNEVSIAEQKVLFDLRYVGDNYYDKCWERDVLKGRTLSPRGFYRPNDKDYFYTLLYHALLQKPTVSDDYRERLTRMARHLGIDGIDKSALDNYMKQMWYEYVIPIDRSVYWKPRVDRDTQNMVYRGMRKLWRIMGRPKVLSPSKSYVSKYARSISKILWSIRK